MALTCTPELQAALDDLAEAMGKPVATLTVDLLVEMIPQLHGLAKVQRAAKAGNQAAAKRALVHLLGDGMAEVLSAQQPDLFKAKRK